MDIRTVILLISIAMFIGMQTTLAQSVNQNNNQEQLISLLSLIEKQMDQNTETIISSNDTAIDNQLTDISKNLEILINVFMPILERLKTTLAQQKTIHNRTKNLADPFLPLLPKESEKETISIALEQTKVRDQSVLSKNIINNQIQQLKQKDENQTNKILEKLTSAVDLISDAIKNKNLALNFLNESQPKNAITGQKLAIDSIVDAIKILSPPEQKKSDSQEKSKDQQSNQTNQSKDQNKTPNKDNTKPKNGQKTTPQDALKKLAQLQKAAEKEKKERAKEYGIPLSPEQLPVEKDW